jgi:hypothetical protein
MSRDESQPSADGIVTGDESESTICGNLGCENPPVEGGYCAECIDISPGILDTDGTDAAEERHRPTVVSPNFEAEPSDACDRKAFADTIAYYHAQLERDIADLGLTYVDDGTERVVETPREWFKEVRGWSDATIDTKRLGWAPASRTGLLDHLMREGHDRDAILGTGLFTERLTPLWQGRFVFPYFDADGQPVYAISRATGDEGGGAVGYDGHPKDGLSGKYAKPAHTKEYARVAEPIYGLGSVVDGEPVLITEGIADAITAHQAGYPCLSPVTIRFKRDDREALREVLEDHDVPRAYVIQDAERPSSDLDEDDRLTLTQAGEGLSGALDTAAYLANHEDGIDARVAELPGPDLGLDKVDLDDYLREWAIDDDLSAVLAGAKPASEHPAYDPQESAIDAADRDRPDPLGSDSNGEQSALFDLSFQRVSGLDRDYRGPNPLGHHGESKTYFVVIDDHDVGYDHKYKVVYNALTYLLCEAGERAPDNPNGRLSDEEMFAAWRHAKREGLIPDDDPVPRRALCHIAVEHGHCGRGDIEDGWKLPRDAYDAALDTIADEYDCEPGRDPISGGWGRATDAVDPLTLDIVLDPELAWRAAKKVSSDHLENADRDLTLAPTDDGDHWQCPDCGGRVDIVRAVALHQGAIARCEESLADDEYDEAYRCAREQFGAPLPKYVSTVTATDNWALVQGAVSQLTHWHLSAIASTVTGLADGNEDVLAELNPTWEESSSEKRIIAFRAGGFYCREHECTIDPLRLVALEQGIIDECNDTLAGEEFTRAYHVAREQYGAPVPQWNIGNPDHIPVLPPADDLLGEFTTDRDRLDAARENVEGLYRELASDTRNAQVLRALPALGKTTSAVKNADEYPTLYLSPRKELQKAVEEKARRYGRSFMHLPIFAEDPPNEAAVREGLDLVREENKDLLRDSEELVERIEAPLEIDDDEDDGDEDIEDRASCGTADGGYGEAWQLAVHIARATGHSPKDIHTRDTAIFGEELPCHDDCECSYKLAWDRATDPDNPKDILIGHYVHGHVKGARKYLKREDDHLRVEERVIAIDEFPADVYCEEFGEEFLDHAAWLGRALCADVEDRQHIFERDLWDDNLVRAWIRGNATSEIPAMKVCEARLGALQRTAEKIRDVKWISLADHESDTGADEDGDESIAESVISAVEDIGPEWDAESIRETHDAMRADTEAEDIPDEVDELIFEIGQLAEIADGAGSISAAASAPERVGDELDTLVNNAIEAFCEQRDGAAGLLSAARTALDGGEEGCRELAAHAHDGYAHPLAHLLLQGIIAKGESATEIQTEAFDFDGDSDTDGTNIKSVQCDRETVLVDRNHQGATVHNPPAFRDSDWPNPVVGLDATGRERLWELAIGTEVEARDIHDTARERRAFLRDVLNLQVVQTTPHTKTYSGSPRGKNFDGDVTLTKAINNEYAGTRLRRDTVTATSKPGVITTKKVEQEIEDRIADDIAAIDHYGNVTGSNALGALNLGIVLGCRHFGDAVVEKWAALAGETVRRSGHGDTLDYDSATGNTFLRHMREDQTLQAVLRFGRDKEGAVVFAHTAALAESLPVVGDGAVVKAFSKNTKAVARAAKTHRGQEFEVSDIADDVDCDRRTVQRALNELTELGYLAKRETKNGLANGFRSVEGAEPGVGKAELPTLDDPFAPDEGQPSDPDETPSRVSSTGFVWVVGSITDEVDSGSRQRSTRATLPAPKEVESVAPPG